MSKVAPALCSSYKGVMPSDLLERYTCEGGMMRLDFDLATLNEIHDQIKESQTDSKDGASMEARRKQRRAKNATLNDGDIVQFLRDNSFIDEAKGA